jgi:hypothetical protein
MEGIEYMIKYKNQLRRYYNKIDKVKIFLIVILAITYTIVIASDVVPAEKRFFVRMALIFLLCCIYFIYLIKRKKN